MCSSLFQYHFCRWVQEYGYCGMGVLVETGRISSPAVWLSFRISDMTEGTYELDNFLCHVVTKQIWLLGVELLTALCGWKHRVECTLQLNERSAHWFSIWNSDWWDILIHEDHEQEVSLLLLIILSEIGKFKSGRMCLWRTVLATPLLSCVWYLVCSQYC